MKKIKICLVITNLLKELKNVVIDHFSITFYLTKIRNMAFFTL